MNIHKAKKQDLLNDEKELEIYYTNLCIALFSKKWEEKCIALKIN